MTLLNQFHSYIHYLIHPFKTHESFINPDRADGFVPEKLSAYESLAFSWVFVIINGLFKIVTLNVVASSLVGMLEGFGGDFSALVSMSEFATFHFMLLSIVLDIIFYPLFGIVIIQYWEFVIKFFGHFLGTEGDLSERAHNVLTVYFSSHIFKIIPIFGTPIHSFASMVLMYAGLRKQLGASPLLSICIMMTPFLMMLMLLSFFFLLLLLMM